MKFKPEIILPLLDEVVVAKIRAAGLKAHPDLTLGEQLDVYRGADQAAANRFDVLAEAYRELVAATAFLRPAAQSTVRAGGLYEHYKGGLYTAILIVKDEATQGDMVVYRAEDGGQMWVRPLGEFCPPRFTDLSAPAPTLESKP